METSNFEFLYAKLGGRHVECFVGIVPTIVLTGNSLNLVQPFSRGDKNKLLLCFCKTAFPGSSRADKLMLYNGIAT